MDYFQLVLDNSNINLEDTLIKTSVKQKKQLNEKIKSIKCILIFDSFYNPGLHQTNNS